MAPWQSLGHAGRWFELVELFADHSANLLFRWWSPSENSQSQRAKRSFDHR